MGPGCGGQEESSALVQPDLSSSSDVVPSQSSPIRLETLAAQPSRCRWACACFGSVPGLAGVADGCGLWSWRGRFRGWLDANTACAGLLGRWPACLPLGPEKLSRAVLLSHCPLSGLPNGCGTLRVSLVKKTGVLAVLALCSAFEGTSVSVPGREGYWKVRLG